MNKKILSVAIISIVLQLMLLTAILPYALLIVVLFYLFAIPFALYHLLRKKQQGLVLNILGVFLTFPLLLIYLFIYKSYFGEYKDETIDPESIEFYDAEGNEIPEDSLAGKIEKDSAVVKRVHIKDSIFPHNPGK